jgi:hypothetical protein
MVKTLTNLVIDNIFRDWDDYGGCFSVHQVNNKRCKNGEFYILNLDEPEDQGTHWVLLDMTDERTNMYYDSYALFIPSEIEKFLMKSKKDFVINPLYNNEQSLNTNTCGYYCIFMMLLRKAGFSPKECIEYFNEGDTTIKYNESIMNYLYKVIPKRLFHSSS